MYNQLEGALNCAELGWKIFPLQNGSKLPCKGWQEMATDDPGIIEQWHSEGTTNFGIATGPSNLTVLDIDMKNGKDGHKTLKDAQEQLGIIPEPTFKVSTPSGGEHWYYEGSTANKINFMGGGLDIRSHGGLVFAPGSNFDGAPYSIIEDTTDFAPMEKLPETWIARIGMANENRNSKEQVVDYLDKPENIRKAVDYLNKQPHLDPSGRNNALFKLAAMVKDFGISRDKTEELLHPWTQPSGLDQTEVTTTLNSVYANSQDPIGSKTDEAIARANQDAAKDIFSVITPQGNEASPSPTSYDVEVISAADFDFNDIPPYDWVLGNRLCGEYVTLTIAPGGVGKSMYTMQEAVAVASGMPITGDDIHGAYGEGVPVWVYNTEDSLNDIKRRIAGICIHFNIPKEKLKNIKLISGQKTPLIMAYDTNLGPVVNDAAIAGLAGYIKKHGIKVLILDPFVRTHRVSENDNMAIDLVASRFSAIAADTGCAVSIVHHSRKKGKDGDKGDLDSGRGASSLGCAARISETLEPMSDQERDAYGISEEDQWKYVRLDEAKGNIRPGRGKEKWLKKISVRLPNGNSVGVLEPVTLEEKSTLDGTHAAEVFDAAAKAIKKLGPCSQSRLSGYVESCTDVPVRTVRALIRGIVMTPVTTEYGTLVAYSKGKNGATIEYVLED